MTASGIDQVFMIDSILSMIYGILGMLLSLYVLVVRENKLKYKYNSKANSSVQLNNNGTNNSTNTNNNNTRKNHARTLSSNSNVVSINRQQSHISVVSDDYKRQLKKKPSFYYRLRRLIIVPCISLIIESFIIFDQSKLSQMINFSAAFLSSASLFIIFAFFVYKMFVAMERTLLFVIPSFHKYSLIFLVITLISSAIVSLTLMFTLDKYWPDGIYFVGAPFSLLYFIIMMIMLMKHARISMNSNKLKDKNSERINKIMNKIASVVKWITIVLIFLIPSMIIRAYVSFTDKDRVFFETGELEGSYLSLIFTNLQFVSIIIAYILSNTIY